jgi:hypothetical protein
MICAASVLILSAFLAGCETPKQPEPAVNGIGSVPEKQDLKVAERPEGVKKLMADRGEQDKASPVLKIVSPASNATITGSTVNVKLALSGDLKGYKPGKNPDGTGNHLHVILDNQPYEAHYHIEHGFELRNLSEGKHTLRVFASRPWHESYKNAAAFQMVSFTVKGGGDAAKPTTTAAGEKMADAKKMPSPPPPASSPAPEKEGKDMPASAGGAVDAKKPLLTYSRPKGEYKDAAANSIMVDFWLQNARL